LQSLSDKSRIGSCELVRIINLNIDQLLIRCIGCGPNSPQLCIEGVCRVSNTDKSSMSSMQS
jgi:hypothetical protein